MICDTSDIEAEDGGGCLMGVQQEESVLYSSAPRTTPARVVGGRRSPSASKKGRGGRPKNKGKTVKGQVKGKRQCQGCLAMIDAAVFPLNSVFCSKDKKAIDNLTYAAKAQDQFGWWQDVKRDMQKLQAVLQAYHARCPEPPPGSKTKRKSTIILEFKEIVRTTTSVVQDEVGEMMHAAAFIH